MDHVRVAAVFLDREATTEKAARLVKEAASEGAGLVVFPEAFVPAYPDWVWRREPWNDAGWFDRLFDHRGGAPGRPRGRRLRRPRRQRARGTRVHALQHPPVLRPRRGPHGQAPQARADGRRAPRVGHGRRLGALGVRHPLRPTFLAGPLTGEEGIVYADLDPSARARQKAQFDTSGHCARPDVLALTVDRRPLAGTAFLPEPAQPAEVADPPE